MPRRRKRLVDVVRDERFRARQDEHLLGAREKLPWAQLDRMRVRYLRAGEKEARREVSLELERGLRELGPEHYLGRLQDELAKLGPPGSLERLEGMGRRFFRHYAGPKAGKPFLFDSYQRAFLEEDTRRNKYGRIYQVSILMAPKGSGKTPFGAVIGAEAFASATDAPEVYNLAGAKDQAGFCHDFASENIRDGALAAWWEVGGGTIYDPTKPLAEWSIMTSDGDLSAGVKPTKSIFDELFQYVHRKQREQWSSHTKALHKRPGEASALGMSTAGWDKQTLLGEIYDAAIAHPKLEIRNDGYLLVLRDEEAGFLFWCYQAPDDADIEDPKVIRAANPAPWVSPRDLLKELYRADTREADWRRLHLNQWCVARDTRILLVDGTSRQACDLLEGEMVVSFDETCDELVPAPVGAVLDNGVKPVFEVVTARGRRVRVTGEHPFWVREGRSTKPVYRWKPAGELSPRDRVAVALGGAPDDTHTLPCDVAQFLGICAGDGSLAQGASIGMTNGEEDIVEWVRAFLAQYGVALRPRGDDPRQWRFTRPGASSSTENPATRLLRHHGLFGKRSPEKRVPEAVIRSGPSAWAAFLSGYFDTDGHASRESVIWSSTSRELLEDCQQMLAMLDIQSTIAVGRNEPIIWRLEVRDAISLDNLAAALTPTCARKASALSQLVGLPRRVGPTADDRRRFDRVVFVAKLPPEPTVAIDVDVTDTHITNGLITHNTGAKEAWLPSGRWRALGAETEIPRGADIYVAVDAAKTYDTTACAWAYKTDSGGIVLRAKVWSAREGTPYHEFVPGGRIRNSLVEDFIAETLAKDYRVREVVYDPRYFDSQGERLAERGLVVAEFPQASAAMADAYQHFYEACLAGTVVHDGDAIFAKHVDAAAAVLTETGWRVYKLRSTNPIDALVAAAMARERAARGAAGAKPFAFLA